MKNLLEAVEVIRSLKKEILGWLLRMAELFYTLLSVLSEATTVDKQRDPIEKFAVKSLF